MRGHDRRERHAPAMLATRRPVRAAAPPAFSADGARAMEQRHGSLVSRARPPSLYAASMVVCALMRARRRAYVSGWVRTERAGKAGGGDGNLNGLAATARTPLTIWLGAPADRPGTEGGHRLARLRPPRRRHRASGNRRRLAARGSATSADPARHTLPDQSRERLRATGARDAGGRRRGCSPRGRRIAASAPGS